MCEDCRISHQFESADNPFMLGTRPTIRTTEDDLRERELELARAKANGGPTGKPGPHEH